MASEHSERLHYTPVGPHLAADLAPALTDPRVYAFIHDSVPTNEQELAAKFARQAAGPPPDRPDEAWWTFAVYETATGCGVGQVEATVHHGLAEVAYLFGVEHWGRGYGRESLAWLHDRLRHQRPDAETFWACVTPPNHRSRRLAERLGYRLWGGDRPELYSHDPGDWVLRRPAAARSSPRPTIDDGSTAS
ncbi:MAG: GNAT family N-acetyltransferase [Planctomycetota bacterium]